MMFAHGYGCSQEMWRLVAPAFADNYKVITFDYIGHGNSDATAYDWSKYASLDGYSGDVVEICEALDLRDIVFVGHSVSAMVGVLAAVRAPHLFSKLILIGPSPRYINDGDYVGGFERHEIDGLLEVLDSNYLGWSSQMAPAIMGNADRPELSAELENSFCRTDPEIAKHFGRVTFLSDDRSALPRVEAEALILQCSEDAIAPVSAGRYMHEHIPRSTFVQLQAKGHCPHLSAPGETIAAIRAFFNGEGVKGSTSIG